MFSLKINFDKNKNKNYILNFFFSETQVPKLNKYTISQTCIFEKL
jgi:hypothetical protein